MEVVSEFPNKKERPNLGELISSVENSVYNVIVTHLLMHTTTLNSVNYTEPVVELNYKSKESVMHVGYAGVGKIQFNPDLFDSYLVGLEEEQKRLVYLLAFAHEHGHHMLYMLGLQWKMSYADREDFSDFIAGLIVNFLFKNNDTSETSLKFEDFEVIYGFVKRISNHSLDSQSERSEKGHGNELVRQANFVDGLREDLVALTRFKFLLKLLSGTVGEHMLGPLH